jgi:Bromodomain
VMADAVSTPPPAAVGDASTPKDGSIDAIAHGVCKKLLEDLARDQHFAPYFETPIDLALYPDYRDHVDRPICYSDIRVRLLIVLWWSLSRWAGGSMGKIGLETVDFGCGSFHSPLICGSLSLIFWRNTAEICIEACV